MTLLQACAERINDYWHGGSRDAYHMMRARLQAESVIEVLRERGLLNEHGIALAQAEIGKLGAESLARMQALDTTPSTP